jgi:chemotaxis protein methyltransferase CheR
METEVYGLVKRSIKSLLDIDLEHYKDEQMKRRLDSWLVRAGAASWPEYLGRVRANDTERARLRDYLTINVSSFFRDPERWAALRQTILPGLLRERPRLRVWSAGCSIGPEPYSLAILLDELSPGRAHSLLATDLDRGALTRARARGPYTADDVQNVTAAQRQHYFEPGGPPFHVRDSLARRVAFRELNLLADPFEADFDLIVCRNVVIYFTEAAKAGLYRKFHDALRPGGVLFVGGTEIVPRAGDLGLRSSGISFYRRQ